MRDSAAIRHHIEEQLRGVLARPSMWGDGQSVELTIRGLLRQLTFIDEREAASDGEHAHLEAEGLFNAMGVCGALMASCGARDDVLPDFVALVLARSAARLGYVAPSRRVEERAFREFVDVFDGTEFERLDELVARLGAPLKEVTSWTQICGWAGPTDDQWIAAGIDRDHSLEFVAVFGVNGAVQRRADDTEEAIAAYRRFLIASLDGREAELRPMLVSRPDPAVLWAGAYPPDVARALGELWSTTEVMQVEPPKNGIWLVSDACPVPLQVVREGREWRVDAEPLMRFRPQPVKH